MSKYDCWFCPEGDSWVRLVKQADVRVRRLGHGFKCWGPSLLLIGKTGNLFKEVLCHSEVHAVSFIFFLKGNSCIVPEVEGKMCHDNFYPINLLWKYNSSRFPEKTRVELWYKRAVKYKTRIMKQCKWVDEGRVQQLLATFLSAVEILSAFPRTWMICPAPGLLSSFMIKHTSPTRRRWFVFNL